MLDRHAEEVWKFVRESVNTAEAIVVSCDAGVSRSPSVAMAIVDHYKLGREAIEWCGRDANGPPPNEWVYDTMMRNAEVA
jgi:protein-tyrosine phosphatase